MSLIHRRLISIGTLVLAACFGFASLVLADTATVSPTSGASAIDGQGLRDTALDTAFNLSVAAGAHCSGNASSGFVVRSYFIGSGVTLSAVDFGALGLPLPAQGTGSGTTFVSALPNSTGSTFSVNPGSSSPFLVTGLPQLSMYRMVNKAAIPNGTYHIGFACVNSTNHVDGNNFWDTAIVITNQAATSMSWAQDTGTTTTTTTTSTTTTTVGGGSSTTTSTTTTTTVGGGSSTTTTHLTTTTTNLATTTTHLVTTTTSGVIPRTGSSSSGSLVVLGLLTLLIGRVVLLVSRPVRILPPSSR